MEITLRDINIASMLLQYDRIFNKFVCRITIIDYYLTSNITENNY